MRGRFRHWFAGASSVLFLVALAPASVAGSSAGEITRAEVDSDWTSARIAGIAVRTSGCEEPPEEPEPPEESEEPEPPEGWEPPDWGPEPEPTRLESEPWDCGWIPFATIGPGAAASDCTKPDRRWGSIGGGSQIVWIGPELHDAGSAAFDVSGIAASPSSPLLCLSAVETVYESRICPAIFDCEGWDAFHRDQLIDHAGFEATERQGLPLFTPPIAEPAAAPRCRKLRRQHRRHGGRAGAVALGHRKAVGLPRAKQHCKAPQRL